MASLRTSSIIYSLMNITINLAGTTIKKSVQVFSKLIILNSLGDHMSLYVALNLSAWINFNKMSLAEAVAVMEVFSCKRVYNWIISKSQL